ncbi:uncharacterized protein LOC111400258 [Olea europaea var. sylvestris]|uniref:uncharacterized protein LOC111400258 n=1 Tax=Olea europaea var. sylvestris TaxID=158386 RepID=UPI000C1D2C77|nr:uncharacterized protein LOC111400258 [Olea europaea var. sylvestris]
MTEFALDLTKVAVSLKYILKEDFPPIRIKHDNNVLSYILLKDMEREPIKYPIIVDVAETEIDNTSITVPINAHFSVTVVYIADAREVEEGRMFCDNDVLKMRLSFFAIQNMFEFMVEQSDKREYVVRCSNGGILGSHRQVSSKVVSSTIKYKYTSSRIIYTPKDIYNDMLNTYGVYLGYSKALRSREQTLKMIRGDPAQSFGKLSSFFYMLRQKNSGTVTEIEVDSHSTIFTACTQDANNSIFVLAFGIGDNENDKSWKWFFDNLKKAYGNKEGLCFVSDRHPSIKNAIEHVYSEACHNICSYHLLQNLKSYYGKSGQNITQAFNSTVRAYTLEEYDYNISLPTTMNEKIISYLAHFGPEKWSRIHMPTNR